MEHLVDNLELVVFWGVIGVEILSVAIIFGGVVRSLVRGGREFLQGEGGNEPSFRHVRLTLAHYLALALEFQLAADLLNTALTPGWEEIGKLAAIVGIRTFLNFFLGREMRELEEEDRRAQPEETHSDRG